MGIELSFTGIKKGVLFLLSVPEIDQATRRLHLKEVEYDLNTRNLMLKSAHWLLDEKIRRKLSENMVFELKDLYDFARRSIQGSLNQKLDGGVVLSGNLVRLEYAGHALGNDALRIRVLASGEISARVSFK